MRYERMYRFQKLTVWQKSIVFCGEIYRVTARFPKEEQYGITAQLRRAAVSIPTNIAEGTGDPSDSEFIRFLRYALRSEHEVASLLLLSSELGLLGEEDGVRLVESLREVGKMLQGLIRKLHLTSEVKEAGEIDIAADLEILLTTDD